jgi:hypothetical protein
MALFSKRMRMGEAAVEWCKKNGASTNSPVNIVTALLSMGLVVVLAEAEREAIERGIDRLVGVEDMSADAGTADDAAACMLRELLERTTL